MTEEYDLIVFDGDMAGLPVAIKSAYAGLETVLVEEDYLGGTCLNRGCIPTKTMLRSAEVANLARRSEEFGIEIDGEVSAEGRVVPWAVFTDPQVGHVGLTEQEARDADYDVGIGRQEFAEQGKPKALGETEGFVKRVTDAETGELLGGHIVGEQGAEIVHELVLAIELGATADDIGNAMHIHPTLPESINSAAGGVHEPS